MTIRLVIPGWAPSKSNSYRIGRRKDGRAVLVKGSPGRSGHAVKDFEVSALAVMLEQRVRPLDGPVSVEARVYPPNLRSDIPGCEKVLLDSLQSWRRVKGKRVPNHGGFGCYANDSQVHRFLVELAAVDPDNPRIEVTVSPLPAQPQEAA